MFLAEGGFPPLDGDGPPPRLKSLVRTKKVVFDHTAHLQTRRLAEARSVYAGAAKGSIALISRLKKGTDGKTRR